MCCDRDRGEKWKSCLKGFQIHNKQHIFFMHYVCLFVCWLVVVVVRLANFCFLWQMILIFIQVKVLSFTLCHWIVYFDIVFF